MTAPIHIVAARRTPIGRFNGVFADVSSAGLGSAALLHEMQRREVRRGLATLCIGGGQGVAICIER